MEEVENQCTSDTAKGRAWIRLSLNRRSLGLFFSSLLGADCLEYGFSYLSFLSLLFFGCTISIRFCPSTFPLLRHSDTHSSIPFSHFFRKFYKASALLRSPDHVTALTPLLLALDGIYFNLSILFLPSCLPFLSSNYLRLPLN